MEQRPISFDLGSIPASIDPSIRNLIINLVDALGRSLSDIADRTQLITSGTLAQRPPATGSHRFFWVTNSVPPHMEFDDGVWRSL